LWDDQEAKQQLAEEKTRIEELLSERAALPQQGEPITDKVGCTM
jgi:hypothetical protein